MKRCLALRMATVYSFIFCACSLLLAQQPSTGLPPLGSFSSGVDTVNLANLNVHLSIPIFSRPGKRLPFDYALTYDSLVWEQGLYNWVPTWVPVPSGKVGINPINNWGWRSATEASTGWVEYLGDAGDCIEIRSDFRYHDPSGGIHPFNGQVQINWGSGMSGCTGTFHITSDTNDPATDNSGYILTTDSSTATVNARGGITFHVPTVNTSVGSGTITDANGNTITINYTSATNTTKIYDTLSASTPALTIVGTPQGGSVSYSYPAPNGSQASVVVHYVTKTVHSCFGGGISEYPATSIPLVDHITLPDTTNYQFTYEPASSTCGGGGQVTGRLASVTLPGSSAISYAYSTDGSNSMMADGSPLILTRTYSGYSGWRYDRSYQTTSSYPTQTATKITDPAGNIINLKFSGAYETERTVHEGSSTVLNYSFRCYNTWTSDSNCPAATVTPPITWSTIDNHLDTVTTDPSHTYAWTAWTYDQYGNVTERQDQDFGTSGSNPTIQHIKTTYNTSLCGSPSYLNICDHPSETKWLDGTTVKADTTYGYDPSTGNLTSLTRITSGTSSLTWQYTYGSGGVLNTIVDPKTTTTTYTNTSCNNAFPTTVSVPADGGGNITRTFTYNCSGGVVTQVADTSNGGVTTTTAYSDPYYWRPASITDQLGKTTQFKYYKFPISGTNVTQPGQVESVLTWTSSQGNSTIDKLATSDGFGRPWLKQSLDAEAGANQWDTVESHYDSLGYLQWVTSPYAGLPGQSGGTEPAEYWDYDALGRVIDE